jgi:hypothetical protein
LSGAISAAPARLSLAALWGGPFRHERNFDRRRRFVPGFGFGFDDYDYGCGYGYSYYTPDSCYPLAYPPAF